MAEFRLIKLSLLLILLLQFTEVTGQSVPSITAREGDEVTLPCENLNDDQDKCDRTSWFFRGLNRSEVDLVTQGQISEKAKSDGLSFTEDCSLVIKNVTDEDAGRYDCQQVKSIQQYGSKLFFLSVIYLKEHDDGEQVTLSCSVSRHTGFTHTVKWLYEGENAAEDIIRYTNMQTSQSECSVTVTFPTTYFNQKSKYLQLFKCEMKDSYTQEVQLFPFSPPRSSGEYTTSSTTLLTRTTAPAISDTSTPPHGWWRVIVVSVGLAALIITVVVVYIWTRTKGNNTQRDDNTVHNDEDEGTVTYENVGEPSASVRLH